MHLPPDAGDRVLSQHGKLSLPSFVGSSKLPSCHSADSYVRRHLFLPGVRWSMAPSHARLAPPLFTQVQRPVPDLLFFATLRSSSFCGHPRPAMSSSFVVFAKKSIPIEITPPASFFQYFQGFLHPHPSPPPLRLLGEELEPVYWV